MTSLLLIFFGTFWETSMDIIGNKHNYEMSVWKKTADYFDKNGHVKIGNSFWDNSLAWRNKWKNGNPTEGEKFFGSSTIFVVLMDGWHVVKYFWLIHFFAAIVFFKPISTNLILDFFICYVCYGIGHEFFLKILQKKV